VLHKIKRRSMLTETQVRTARTGELEELRNRIEAELAWRDLSEKEPAPGRQVVGEKPHSAGTLRLEMVKCGKDRCRKCAKGPAHGPYWYLYFRRSGKLTSKYIGKTEDPEGVLEKKLG
jgi:hypothetical protein